MPAGWLCFFVFLIYSLCLLYLWFQNESVLLQTYQIFSRSVRFPEKGSNMKPTVSTLKEWCCPLKHEFRNDSHESNDVINPFFSFELFLRLLFWPLF